MEEKTLSKTEPELKHSDIWHTYLTTGATLKGIHSESHKNQITIYKAGS
jgi:hypothetical protein